MSTEGMYADDIKEQLASVWPDADYQKKERGIAYLAKWLEDEFNAEPLEHNGKKIDHTFSACALLPEPACSTFIALLTVEIRFLLATDAKLTKPLREQWDAIFGSSASAGVGAAEETQAAAPDSAEAEPAEAISRPLGYGARRAERSGVGVGGDPSAQRGPSHETRDHTARAVD